MTDSEMEDFGERYEANFGSPPAGSAAIWREFLDTVPSNRVRELTENVARNRKGHFRPGLEEFKKAWMNITGEAARMETCYCPHCHNGLLEVMGYFDKGRFVISDSLVEGHEPWRNGGVGLDVRFTNCMCDTGQKRGLNTRAQELVDWIVMKKLAWGFEQTGDRNDNAGAWDRMLRDKLGSLWCQEPPELQEARRLRAGGVPKKKEVEFVAVAEILRPREAGPERAAEVLSRTCSHPAEDSRVREARPAPSPAGQRPAPPKGRPPPRRGDLPVQEAPDW